jgi:KUP system potassium uptake protein
MTTQTPSTEGQDVPGVSSGGPAPGAGRLARPSFLILALGSIGVVYGDIGTSPLYALREAVKAALLKDGAISEPVILGVLSLMIWTLILIVTVKYVLVLLNADNNGEGGTLSLMALAQRGRGKFLLSIPLLGMLGAALFYGDAIITPAISVLSAVEGLNLITPAFEHYILWITLAIIVGLFAVQSSGTARVAALFGPITLMWFAAIALAGLPHIIGNPAVLLSFNPVYAVSFLSNHGTIGLITLGAVFLTVTGAEALYADLGHFGKKPIRMAWLVIVLPALLLNYLGQGALLLHTPSALENPFFLLVPDWALLPMVLLATAATIIASQAVITGAYSLTRQAIQLGILPRMQVRFTSESHAGQIYMPQVNWLLMIGVIILVLAFKTSSALSTAYGIAVTGTMVVTALLAIFVIRNRWKWSIPATLGLMLPLLALDVIFLGANSLKIAEGGWMPLAIAAAIVLIMWTWRLGTRQVAEKTRKMEVQLKGLVDSLEKRPPHKIGGTAVFFTSDASSAPTALLHSLKHYKVLHEKNVILTLKTTDEPKVPDANKLKITHHSPSFTSIVASLGFMEMPDVPALLKLAEKEGLVFNDMTTSFFLSRRNVLASPSGGMPLWQDKLFIMLARGADDASHYFRLPTDRVVEVGSQITI